MKENCLYCIDMYCEDCIQILDQPNNSLKPIYKKLLNNVFKGNKLELFRIKELKKRRWFAVDAVHLAEDIRASARGEV